MYSGMVTCDPFYFGLENLEVSDKCRELGLEKIFGNKDKSERNAILCFDQNVTYNSTHSYELDPTNSSRCECQELFQEQWIYFFPVSFKPRQINQLHCFHYFSSFIVLCLVKASSKIFSSKISLLSNSIMFFRARSLWLFTPVLLVSEYSNKENILIFWFFLMRANNSKFTMSSRRIHIFEAWRL